MNTQVFFILILVLLAIGGIFFIPRFLMRRALSQVIRIFRKNQAISVKSAKTIDELGLRPRTFMESMMKTRDYKPYALDILRNNNIIVVTEEGKLYLSEERLANSGLRKWARVSL